MQKHHTDRLRDLKCNLLAFLLCLISRVCFNHLFLRELLIWFIFTSPSITVHCTCLVQIWKFYKTLNLILFFTDEWIHYHCSGPRPPDTVAVGAKDSPINFVAWNMRFFSVISNVFLNIMLCLLSYSSQCSSGHIFPLCSLSEKWQSKQCSYSLYQRKPYFVRPFKCQQHAEAELCQAQQKLLI